MTHRCNRSGWIPERDTGRGAGLSVDLILSKLQMLTVLFVTLHDVPAVPQVRDVSVPACVWESPSHPKKGRQKTTIVAFHLAKLK